MYKKLSTLQRTEFIYVVLAGILLCVDTAQVYAKYNIKFPTSWEKIVVYDGEQIKNIRFLHNGYEYYLSDRCFVTSTCIMTKQILSNDTRTPLYLI